MVDSGVRTSHVAFGGRAHWGANFNNDVDEDEHGHGTAVASIAASISKNAQIYAVKVLGPQNTGSLSGILAGMEWAINHAAGQKGQSVINMSIGSDSTEVYKTLIQKALEKNIALFFAAGNNNEDACTVSPARFAKDFTGVFTVGASNLADNMEDWSGYGNCVSMVAPVLPFPLPLDEEMMFGPLGRELPWLLPLWPVLLLTGCLSSTLTFPLSSGSSPRARAWSTPTTTPPTFWPGTSIPKHLGTHPTHSLTHIHYRHR